MNYDLYPHRREYFPSEASRAKGYYECDVGTVRARDRKVATHTTKVTPRGLEHLRRLIKKDFDLSEGEG